MKKRNSVSFIGVALLLASLFVMTGCGANTVSPGATEGTTPPAQSGNIIKIGTDPTFAPFEFKDEQDKLTGFDVDLMNAIGKDIGSTVKIESSSFDGLIPSLQAGKYDAIIAAMTITDDRSKNVLFSDKYLMATQYIATKKGSNIKTVEDLKGKKVGVQNATTGQTVLEKLGMAPKKYDTVPDALTDLVNGGLDAVVADSPVVLYFIKQYPKSDVQYIKGDFPKEYYGIAFKLGNQVLDDKMNASLKKLRENGKYNEIYKKWFNEDAPKL